MPRHVYECECGNRFDAYHQFGDSVGWAPCPACGKLAHKSWSAGDVGATPVVDRPEYYEEQLGAYISGPSSIKKACKKIYERSGGQCSPDWH